MPCNADYMEPTSLEQNLLTVKGLLAELEQPAPTSTSIQTVIPIATKEQLNILTAELFQKLQREPDDGHQNCKCGGANTSLLIT